MSSNAELVACRMSRRHQSKTLNFPEVATPPWPVEERSAPFCSQKSDMATTRKIEIFGAGCAVCEEAIDMIVDAACSSDEIIVRDMKDTNVVERARSLGIRSVPAIVIDDKLADCCSGRGVDVQVLRAAGLGQPL